MNTLAKVFVIVINETKFMISNTKGKMVSGKVEKG